MSAHDTLRKSRDVLGTFYDAILEPTRWPDALGGYAAQFRASHAILAAGNGGANGPQIDWAGVVPEYQEHFRRFVRGNNPIQIAPGQHYHGLPYTDRMVMPATAFHRTDFYQDWCRPQYIETVMGAAIIQDERGIVLLGLGRADPFSDAELTLHRSLMPELDRIMALRLRLMELDLQRARLRALLDQVGTPILLANSTARLLHANRAAETLLRAGDVLVLAQGRLAGVTERQTDVLRSLIRRAGSNAAGQNLTIHADHGRTAWIAILPVHADHGWAEGTCDGVALFVTVSEQNKGTSATLLQALYGLTPAEAAVAELVSQGGGVPAAASALGIKTSTVRSHLHRIFDKTGTERQSQLAALLRSLPRTAPGS
jgi:DNA-binding CsgD family transcriptional regulator/PAS domain-containing protein